MKKNNTGKRYLHKEIKDGIIERKIIEDIEVTHFVQIINFTLFSII